MTSEKVCRFIDEVVLPWRKELSAKKLKAREQERKAILASRAAVPTSSSSSNNRDRKKRKTLLNTFQARALEIAEEVHVDLETARALAEDDIEDIEGVDAAAGMQEVDEDGLPPLDGGPLSYGTIDTWMAAISELQGQQKALGSNLHPSFRGAAFKAKMDALKSLQVS